MTAATQIHADLASLKNAIETMSEGFSLFDADNCLVLCNGRYREMYGYSESDACPGVHISKLLRMDVELNTVAQVGGEEAIRRRLETFGKTEETFDLPLADGRWVQVRDRKTSDGGIVCIHADISRHKKTEEALSDQLIFTEALVDIIPNPILVKDPELRYVTFNRAFEEAFNMKREDFIGKTVLDVERLPLELREQLTNEDTELIRTGGEFYRETTRLFADGKEHDLLFWHSVFKLTDGNTGGLVAVFVDISEQKNLERELAKAADAADVANQAKSAFLANMSHELRTPMNAILGYAEMLAEDAEDDGNDDQLADIREIIDSGEHLLSLVNDVLDLSKVEAGRMDLYLETFDITKMAKDVVSTTVALTDKGNNKLVLEVAEDAGDMHADLTKVRQNLFNLISNAAKFTSDGIITLSIKRHMVRNSERILMSVIDTGIGIPEGKLDQVFEEFAQAEDTTTRNYGGTGLGLALVQKFCEMMGGRVWVESAVGTGSTFSIDLPAVVTEDDQELGPALEN